MPATAWWAERSIRTFRGCLKAPPELAVGGLGARQIHACQPQAFRNLTLERVLESVRVLMQPRAISIRRIPCAQRAKGDLGGGEVRLRLLDDAPQRLECRAMPIHHAAHARVEGRPAKV